MDCRLCTDYSTSEQDFPTARTVNLEVAIVLLANIGVWSLACVELAFLQTAERKGVAVDG
jgi:hypothetical protein